MIERRLGIQLKYNRLLVPKGQDVPHSQMRAEGYVWGGGLVEEDPVDGSIHATYHRYEVVRDQTSKDSLYAADKRLLFATFYENIAKALEPTASE